MEHQGRRVSASGLHFNRTVAGLALLAVSPVLTQCGGRGIGAVAWALGLATVVILNPTGFVELAGFGPEGPSKRKRTVRNENTGRIRGARSKRTENLCKAMSRKLSWSLVLERHTFATEKCPSRLRCGDGRATYTSR